MDKLSDKIVKLRLETRRICMCEGEKSTATMTIKTKALYLIQNNITPNEIINTLNIAKTNLAILAHDMINEGLIIKKTNLNDKRQISYSITPKGQMELNQKLSIIENRIKKVTNEKEYNEQLKKFDELLNFLSFI